MLKSFIVKTILDDPLDNPYSLRIAAESHSKAKHFVIDQIRRNYLNDAKKYPFDYIKSVRRDPESDCFIRSEKIEPHFFYV